MTVHFAAGLHQNCSGLFHLPTSRPTRYRQENVPNPLDLIHINEDGMVNNVNYPPELGLSDHACLCFDLNRYAECKVKDEPQYINDHGDYERLNSLLEQIEWEEDIKRLNYRDAWDYFAGTYTEMIDDCIPKNKSVKGKKNKYLTREAMKCRHTKYHNWKRFTESEDYLDYARFA